MRGKRSSPFRLVEILRRFLLVDNGSTDGSFDRLRQNFEGSLETGFIDNGANLGFGRGNNVGIRYAPRERGQRGLVVQQRCGLSPRIVCGVSLMSCATLRM